MRLLSLLIFAVLAAAFGPNPALAEGVLHSPPLLHDGSPPLYRPQHSCTPGQNATDPDCAQAKLDDCLGRCRHDFTFNGDVMYLRWCERECEAEWAKCGAGM